MHALTESVWEVISWKSKSRYDNASDQYTRIFMPKLFIASSFIMAFSYFNDKLNCLVSSRLDSSREFVQESCWIQGFYIYREMHQYLNESAFYGIPEHINHDGLTIKGQLCATVTKLYKRNTFCRPMNRSMAVFYFFPYLVFKFGNSDMISLVDTVRSSGYKDVEKIASNYFNYKINSKLKMRLTVWFNIFVKLLFILVNISGFVLTDYVFDGRFFSYGSDWLRWNSYPNHIAHRIKRLPSPKPGDCLLPSVGMCDLHEVLNDGRLDYVDKHKVICEISQNIRYQYIFIILWFFFVLGIFVSILGLFQAFFVLAKSMYWILNPKQIGKKSLSDRVHSQLTLREMEYLDKIRHIDMTIYGQILRELTRLKPDIHTIKKYQNTEGEIITILPSAPLGPGPNAV